VKNSLNGHEQTAGIVERCSKCGSMIMNASNEQQVGVIGAVYRQQGEVQSGQLRQHVYGKLVY
jgi:hypothetical protein